MRHDAVGLDPCVPLHDLSVMNADADYSGAHAAAEYKARLAERAQHMALEQAHRVDLEVFDGPVGLDPDMPIHDSEPAED